MKRIIVLTTGGTIAMRADAQAGGAVPQLGGADFLAGLPRGFADVQFVEFSNLPSAHFTLEHIWNLSRRVAALVADDAVDGVVVTHGTDTLEESAYLCDVTIDTRKPIVFTGAMRTASELGYDGIANIASAIQVAASDVARDLGVLVLFNDEIHAAREVTKTHTTALDTFQSPEWGALGRVDYAGVIIAHKPAPREFIPAARLETNVHLLALAVGMSEGLFEYLVETVGARGVVLETLGGGRVPPWWLPAIGRATQDHIAVVVTSRVGAGRTIDRYGYVGAHRDLANLGCWFADGVSGRKARLKLMATLALNDPQRFWRVDY
ncbi:MAG: asparaginase [Chloroflexi bacterium]|nr:asparaginase [Chloroflexota bacterium]